MDNLKSWLEVADLFFKVSLAALAFLLFGVESQRLTLETTRTDLSTKQQTSNLVVAEKIITLLFDAKNKCIAEDQSFMIDFLIDNNNLYNKILINKQNFYRASAARRNCSNGSIAMDSKSSASLNEGKKLPVLTNSQDLMKNQQALAKEGVEVKQLNPIKKIDGYVAVGVFSDNSFRNFIVPNDSFKPDGTVSNNSIIRSRWSVYLRANTSNTEGGSNPILGLVKENACVQVIESFPSLRGQTWAAVNLIKCP